MLTSRFHLQRLIHFKAHRQLQSSNFNSNLYSLNMHKFRSICADEKVQKHIVIDEQNH